MFFRLVNHPAVSHLGWVIHISRHCVASWSTYIDKIFTEPTHGSKLVLTAPVIRDVAHGPFNCQGSSRWYTNCQFEYVKSWHTFFNTRGVLEGVSKLKCDATMSSKHTSTPTRRENFLLAQNVLSEILISAAKLRRYCWLLKFSFQGLLNQSRFFLYSNFII